MDLPLFSCHHLIQDGVAHSFLNRLLWVNCTSYIY